LKKLRTRSDQTVQDIKTVPGGSNVLIDANIFIYALSATSADCKALLERVSREEITGITLFEVVHEATHRFMIAEATQKGIFAGQPEKGAKFLSKNPRVVRTLSDYWVNTQRLMALNLLLLPMERSIVSSAQKERAATGLLTNDSIIVATMRAYGISAIATNDSQFDTVPGITVFSPTDVV
jgi:predicted nucleic acid-binding protein